jgi:two-component system sensor histidine kinase KdpD
VCLIDGLAYGNPPGSKNRERWQDVEELLAAGISVTTTINLQYVRERQAQVEAIRGKRVEDSVPESFLRQADEIEIVDTPGLEQPELREIALLLAAEVVDQGVEQNYGTCERILICITPRSNAGLMIARGRRQADRFHGELFVAYVEQDELMPADRRTLEENLEAARRAEARVEVLHGDDPVAEILRFAEREGVTQIFVGHSQRRRWWRDLRPNPVERLILEADGIDIRIFPNGGVCQAN